VVSSELIMYVHNPSCICMKSEFVFEFHHTCTGFDGSVLVDRQENHSKMPAIRIPKKKLNDSSQLISVFSSPLLCVAHVQYI
jgi:hypothetical protein